MLRGMLLVSLVAGAFAVGLYWNGRPAGQSFIPGLPTAPAKKQQSCADDCEQNALLRQAPDSEMRACKARCGDPEPVVRPHEVPRSITVAPADHRGGLLPPPERRITRTH